MNRFDITLCGVHADLLDTVMWYTTFFMGDAYAQRFTVILDLNVSFLTQSGGKILLKE